MIVQFDKVELVEPVLYSLYTLCVLLSLGILYHVQDV